MRNDLEKMIHGLLDETESLFRQRERLEESLQESYRRLCDGSGWQGEEFRRIALEIEETYAAVLGLLPRVATCLRASAFYFPECSALRTRFAEIENTVAALSPSDQMQVSVTWVLIQVRPLLLDALRLTSERPATAEGCGKNVRHRVLTVEQGTNGAEFLTPKQVAVR